MLWLMKVGFLCLLSVLFPTSPRSSLTTPPFYSRLDIRLSPLDIVRSLGLKTFGLNDEINDLVLNSSPDLCLLNPMLGLH